jgi:hypothetical protein
MTFQNSDAQGQLTAAVDELLDQLQSKFENVSTEMFAKRTSLPPLIYTHFFYTSNCDKN